MGNNETTPLRPHSSRRIHEGERESDKRDYSLHGELVLSMGGIPADVGNGTGSFAILWIFVTILMMYITENSWVII